MPKRQLEFCKLSGGGDKRRLKRVQRSVDHVIDGLRFEAACSIGLAGVRRDPLKPGNWILPDTNVLIRPPRPSESGEFSALMALYEEAIPASERKSRAQVASMMREPGYRFLAAFVAERLVGFAIVYRFRGERLSLLEYMAVDPAHRRQGIGGQLFRAALGLSDAETPLLLEVDSDRESSEDHPQRVKRKRFYRRLGCREIADLNYVLPIGQHPPRMDLLVHDPQCHDLDRAAVLHWLTLLYIEVYGCSASDPRIAVMAASLPEKIALI